jgi:hypothetical protein
MVEQGSRPKRTQATYLAGAAALAKPYNNIPPRTNSPIWAWTPRGACRRSLRGTTARREEELRGDEQMKGRVEAQGEALTEGVGSQGDAQTEGVEALREGVEVQDESTGRGVQVESVR